MAIWRTMWRSHGAIFIPASVAAFSARCMEVGCDVEVKVAHRALGIALVEWSYLPTAQAPLHHVTQDRRPRLVEVLG